MSSDKREAFRPLAEKRTNAVTDKICLLANCSNPHAYEYDDDDGRKFFGAIERELRAGKAQFENQRRRRFRLTERRVSASVESRR